MRAFTSNILKRSLLKPITGSIGVRPFSSFPTAFGTKSTGSQVSSMNKGVYTMPVRFVRRKNEIDDQDHTLEDEEKFDENQSYEDVQKKKNRDYLYYVASLGFVALGASYLAVPLYAAFCQMVGAGGTVQRDQQVDELNEYTRRTLHLNGEDDPLRPIQVVFQASVHPDLKWTFEPCQSDITLRIGETALAFYKAKNNMKKPYIGVSTYNVLPAQAGVYFNKIQCFCFDEQRLRAGEEMDMPIFFFLDPAMADDWRLDGVDQVTLSYTFFPSSEDEVHSDMHALNNAGDRPTPAMSEELDLAKISSAATKKNITNPTTTNNLICEMPTAQHNPTGKSV